jgi:hypothetical protein
VKFINLKTALEGLSPSQQQEFAQLGLLLAYAIRAQEILNGQYSHEPALGAAEGVAYHALDAAIDNTGLLAILPPPLPDLRLFGVRQCRGCGCTDLHACPGGCSWVAPDLCSRCQPIEDAAA